MFGRYKWSILLLVAALGCNSVGDFSTGPDECYEGPIVTADYVRSSSLSVLTTLTLTLNTGALSECRIDAESEDAESSICEPGAHITTNDEPRTFDNAPVRAIKQVPHDSISLLQFPGGRIRNYVAYAYPTEGPAATVVISLMENDEVEVRIMRPPGYEEFPDLFGVFRLVRKEGCVDAALE